MDRRRVEEGKKETKREGWVEREMDIDLIYKQGRCMYERRSVSIWVGRKRDMY